jgi:hypothetical protein
MVMSFLERYPLSQKRNTKLHKTKEFSLSVRNKRIFSPINIMNNRVQGRTSPSTSLKKHSVFLEGSLTIEAALSLTLFLFIFLFFTQLYLMLGIQIRMGKALQECGQEIGMHAYVYENSPQDLQIPEELGRLVPKNLLSQLFVKEKMLYLWGEERLNHSIVAKGSRGLDFYFSRLMKEEAEVDIIVSYKIKPIFQIFDLPHALLYQRSYVRAWVGWRDIEGQSEEEELVYVTDTGHVYHKNHECTYLNLSISKVSAKELESLRNEAGGKYYLCEKCQKNNKDTPLVYITETGNRYHSSLECSGLKRRISKISITKAGDRRACSRCSEK